MEVKLSNVGIIKEADLKFIPGLNLIVGSSSSGKSTLLRAIRCMMDNSFSDSHISYGKKKMEIQIKYNGHDATYTRDLDNQSRKSAYLIDGKTYTKLGRTSLDDLTTIFKMSPKEIDGEKINFNFSSQFAGPFLLLGSPSLLYSILTYRSTFDITKINDLYFTDYKKVKQDLNVLQKTRESLEKERDNKEKQLSELAEFPHIYLRVQRLKQQFDTLQVQRNLYASYKEALNRKEQGELRLKKIHSVLSAYVGYSERLLTYTTIMQYSKVKLVKENITESVEQINLIRNKVKEVLPTYTEVSLLNSYLHISKQIRSYTETLGKVSIQDCRVVDTLKSVLQLQESIEDKKRGLLKADSLLQQVNNDIQKVDVCPLCNQPISHSH